MSAKSTSLSAPQTLVSIFDAKAAHALATLFNDELIPATVISSVLPMTWDVVVPSEFLAQAQLLYDQHKLSERELLYLATGALGEE
jgi:hypothetical protein